MKFELSRASNKTFEDDETIIEINTIQELLTLQERDPHHALIVDFQIGRDWLPSIIIYDDYME